MSKPRYRWWPYVKAVIRVYPGVRESVHSQLSAAGIVKCSADAFKSGAGQALKCMAAMRLSGRDVANMGPLDAPYGIQQYGKGRGIVSNHSSVLSRDS